MLCVFNMDTSGMLCSLHIPGGDSIHQITMLVHGFHQTSGIAHGTTANAGELFTQIIDNAAQTLIAAGVV